MAVDRAGVLDPQVLEEGRGDEDVLEPLFEAVQGVEGGPAGGALRQDLVGGVLLLVALVAALVLANTPAESLYFGVRDAEVGIQTALCAEAVGAMERSLDLTVEYLKSRKQFGVTLSAFQALTHRAADMYVQLELARSLSLYATSALADGIAELEAQILEDVARLKDFQLSR